jgi:hypothetical protein
VLELAAERGLEGRVVGVHARAALRPLYCRPLPLSAAGSGDPGLRGGGRGRGRTGEGEEQVRGGGAGVAARRGPTRHGAAPIGCRPHPLPPWRGRRRKSCTRSSAAQDKHIKCRLAGSRTVEGESGGESRRKVGSGEGRGPFLAGKVKGRSRQSGLVQCKNFKLNPLWLCHNAYYS